jgi:NAD(P)-dependent dehydrogenase (short-subunit alcohol dehydrogenase family)
MHNQYIVIGKFDGFLAALGQIAKRSNEDTHGVSVTDTSRDVGQAATGHLAYRGLATPRHKLAAMKPLFNKIALVAGATRGAGRGIAAELGAAGATVYCTGRSTRQTRSDMGRSECIEESAELVTALGGTGIAIQCDHSQESQVVALIERIKSEQGRIDILVNDIWGGEKLIEWGKKFWELETSKTFRLIERAIYTHIITARHAVPLMPAGSLAVEITDGEYGYYRGNFAYDLVKNAVIRMAKAMAVELKQRQITAVAITPGFLRSEEMLEAMQVTENTWQNAKEPDFATMSETPRYIGRAIAALASDGDHSRYSGQTLSSWGLMRHYNFTDIDGRQPDWGKHFAATYPDQYPEI